MSQDDKDALITQVTSAWRPQSPDGTVQAHPAWHDLDEADRLRAFEETTRARALEAALDPAGLSPTARAILEKIQQAGRS